MISPFLCKPLFEYFSNFVLLLPNQSQSSVLGLPLLKNLESPDSDELEIKARGLFPFSAQLLESYDLAGREEPVLKASGTIRKPKIG